MLELTGWCRHGDSFANLGPKTPKNMGSSCEKKYDHCQFLIFTFSLYLALLRSLAENSVAEHCHKYLLNTITGVNNNTD